MELILLDFSAIYSLLAEVSSLFGVFWAVGHGKRYLCRGSKLTLIQPPTTALDGTLQTACPMICLLTVT